MLSPNAKEWTGAASMVATLSASSSSADAEMEEVEKVGATGIDDASDIITTTTEAALIEDTKDTVPKTPPLTATSTGNVADTNDKSGTSTSAAAAAASSIGTPKSTRICKNVIIYGYCKFEGKGCQFNHNTNPPKAAEPEKLESGTPSRLNATSPVFTPQNRAASPTQGGQTAPAEMMSSLDLGNAALNNLGYSTYETPNAQSHSVYGQSVLGGMYQPPARHANILPFGNTNGFTQQLTRGMSSLGFTENENTVEYVTPRRTLSAGETLYANELDNGYVFQPLQHHLYTAPLHNLPSLAPNQRTVHGFFVADSLRRELLEKQEELTHNLTVRDPELPPEVHVYHTLYPLDDRHIRLSQVVGHTTHVYKAVSRMDGRSYLLRRVEGFRMTHQANMGVAETWRRLRHANLVSVHEVFTTKAFGDHSLIIVYDYFPRAPTLFEKYFVAPKRATTPEDVHIPESLMWSFIIQILSIMKTIHTAGMALRVLDLTNVLLTNQNRLRVGCCGMYDILGVESNKMVAQAQQEDMLQFGQLLLSLACNSLNAVRFIPKSLEFLSSRYSPDMKNVIIYLLTKPYPMKSLDDVVTICGPRMLGEINSMHLYNDQLENELTRELENGRLVRLLCKFGFINERPEFDMDPRWSETGDRYLLKLFRDYVFHQVDENGRPVVDLAHVISCLNKLDAGVDEKVMLVSRDEQSCLIVTYRELRNCVAQTFDELSQHQSQAASRH
ncbi:hypothetical protein BDF22DRAFT_687290 [Syncephalis plumigaleata]|nr:hypothetical protein BDF22DRAFT_687290 [Syncephalis plumigaleata]